MGSGSNYKPGDVPVPDYKVESFLGEGGYGCVYKVVNVKTGISKALKVITLRDTQGYKEYTALALFKEIRHPNLVPIEHYWLKDEQHREIKFNEDESLNIASRGVVELLILLGLGDQSLADRLKKCVSQTNTGIPVEDLMDYMSDIAKAIDFLNTPKRIGDRDNVAIQHGDIKPGNVMIVGTGVQVGDYGLAQAISVTPETGKSKTTTGGMAGTPEYAAPEQVGGKASRSSDQYSLAISYYEMRTGRLPFDDQANRYACLAVDGLDFSLVPPAEQEILTKATDRQFAKRYNTCLEFVRALKRAHAHAGFGTMVNIPVYRDPEPAKPARVELLDKLKEGSEDFLPDYQVGKNLGRNNDEELWQITAKSDRQNYLLKVIRCTNTGKAFEEYNALSKLHNITFDKILNIERLWVVDRMGKEIASEHLKQANVLFDKIILVLIESVEKTLEDHVLDMKKNPYSDRLKRKWYDVINHICKGADYWNKHCYRAYRELNPASILVNRFDQIKIDSAGVARYLRKDRPSATNLADSFSFIAPEVFDSHYCDQSDQYSLAMIYYWLCMGDTIFPASFKPADIKNYLQDSYLDFTRDLPDEAEILTRATLLDPQMRFPDSIEFIQAFEVALKITSIESYNAQKLRDHAKAKVEQLVEAVAPSPVTDKPKGTTPRAPARGQSIQFPGLNEEAPLSRPTENDITPSRPTPRETAPKDWKNKPERESVRKPPSKPAVEPVNEPFSLDDDIKPPSPWPFRVILGILLIGVFAGTLYLLNKYMGPGPIGSNSSPIPTPSQTDPDVVAGGGGSDKGTKPINGDSGSTVPTVPALNWEKDYRSFKDSLKSADSLAALSKALKTGLPALQKTHVDNAAAGKLLSGALAFDTLLQGSDAITTKPLTEQTKWIKEYQAGKAALDTEMAGLYTPFAKTVEAKLVTHAAGLTERAPETPVAAERQSYFETIKPFATDARTIKLLETGIAECALESGSKSVQVADPAKDDTYGNYVAALAVIKSPKPDFTKAVSYLEGSVKSTEKNLVMQDQHRRKAVTQTLSDAIATCRNSTKGLADFSKEKTALARKAMELLLQVYGNQPAIDRKTTDRLHGELAVLLAAGEPKTALVHFAAIGIDLLDPATFSEQEQTPFYTSYMTALSKEPGYDQQKALCASRLLSMLSKKQPGIDLEKIQTLCIKTLTENTKLEAIDKPAAQALSQSLLELFQTILKDPAEAKRTLQDDNAKVDSFLLNLATLGSRLNPDNSQCRVYGQLMDARLLSLSSMFFSYEMKSLEQAMAQLDVKYIETHQPSHYTIHLVKAINALLPLKEAMENQQDAAPLKALHTTCKTELELLTSKLDDAAATVTDFERMSAHTLAAYMYNVLANNTDETGTARTYLTQSIKSIEAAERHNTQLGNPLYELEIQNIRGLTYEDQAWVLRDPATSADEYIKALAAYGVVQEKAAARSRLKAKATVDISRCIYRFASTSSKGSYESRLSGAETIISEFLNDAAYSDQFPREKIEALYFVAKLHRSQLATSIANIAEITKTADRLGQIIKQLETAQQLSAANNGYYLRNILIDLALRLEDQTALIAEPQNNKNIYHLTSKNAPDAAASKLLEFVKNNKLKLNKIAEDYQARYPTIADFCTGIDLLYESAKLLNEWSKSEKLDTAFDLFKKAINDPNKELLTRTATNLMKIALVQCEHAFPLKAVEGNEKRQELVGSRWIFATDMLIETDKVVNKNPFLTSTRAANMSRRFFGLYLSRYNHKFMLTSAVNCMVRSIALDTGEKSPFASPTAEASSNLSTLYKHLLKDTSMNSERARIEDALKTKWGNKMPSHLSTLLSTENK